MIASSIYQQVDTYLRGLSNTSGEALSQELAKRDASEMTPLHMPCHAFCIIHNANSP